MNYQPICSTLSAVKTYVRSVLDTLLTAFSFFFVLLYVLQFKDLDIGQIADVTFYSLWALYLGGCLVYLYQFVRFAFNGIGFLKLALQISTMVAVANAGLFGAKSWMDSYQLTYEVAELKKDMVDLKQRVTTLEGQAAPAKTPDSAHE